MVNATIPANAVTEVAPAPSEDAVAYFQHLLTVETDCYDVHQALKRDERGFILLDVRSLEAYATGHLPHAISFPHRRITETRLAQYAADTLFVVYCSGPHCNGADRAALWLARLGRPVKKMIGGITGWRDEGYELVTA